MVGSYQRWAVASLVFTCVPRIDALLTLETFARVRR